MITELTDPPAGTIGFEASGKLAAEDYRDVLLPAVERASAAGDVRMVLVISSFDGLTAGAVLAGPEGRNRAPAGLEAHRPRHRHRVDEPDDRDVRVDDTRRGEALPDGRAGGGDRLDLRLRL